jgi:hypothetical protein
MGGGGNIAPLPTPAAVAAILADRPAVAAAAAAAAAAHHRANSTDYNPRHFDSSATMLALPQTPISQETLLAGSGIDITAKDSDEVSMDNGSNNGDVTITTSNSTNIQSGSQLSHNLNNHQTNIQITQKNNAASSTTSNIDTSSVLAARDKSLISQAMAKVTKSLKADTFLSSSPSSEGDYGSGGGEDSDADESSDDLLNKIDDLVINDRLIRFRLATPTPMPSYLNVHFICETASRLLFLSVHWVRSIPAFSLLRYDTQVALVRNAWSDIFVLGMAQCAQTMNLQNILSSIVSHLQTSVSQDKLSATRVRQVTTTICKIQEYVRALNKLNVDEWEFAYLKAISLFGADKMGIASARQLDKIRDKTVEELKDYCLKDNNNMPANLHNEVEDEKMDFSNTHTTSTTRQTIASISHDHPGLTRFSDLLLRLSPLRSLQPDVLEELFFAGLIGNVQIDSVVPYILKMEASEYQTSPFVKDDIKVESDIDSGKSNMDVANEERISVDTYSTNDKDDQD